MTGERLYEAVGEIKEEYIWEAKDGAALDQSELDQCGAAQSGSAQRRLAQNGSVPRKTAQRGIVWSKWGVIAACLCLLVVVGGIYRIKGNGGQDFGKTVPPINLIEFGGAYYEDIPLTETKVLDNYNLPREITEDMVGSSLGVGYAADGKRTEQTFYQYLPYAGAVTVTGNLEQERHQRAVYVLEEEGVYSYALFCNFLMLDDNTHTEASEMFAVYGIDEATDIAYMTIDGKRMDDPQKIAQIFGALWQSYAMGNEDYQKTIYGGKSEEAQQALSKELADSAVEINMVTTEGIAVRNIRYYPEIQYVSWRLNYYKLEGTLE